MALPYDWAERTPSGLPGSVETNQMFPVPSAATCNGRAAQNARTGPPPSLWLNDDGKVLDLEPDQAGNPFEVVSVLRDDGTEIMIHAMRMRRRYEPLLHPQKGDADG